MARRPRKSATPKTIKATARDLKEALREAAGAKQRAKNANEGKTNTLTDYATRSGFSGRALRLGLELHALEDVKRSDLVRELLMIHQMMGWGEQSDLFDDVGAMIAAAAKAAADDEAAKDRLAGKTPSLPLEALAEGIKPLDEAKAGGRKGKNALPGAPKGSTAPVGAPETVA